MEIPSLEAVSFPRKRCEIEEKSSKDTTDYKRGMGYGETVSADDMESVRAGKRRVSFFLSLNKRTVPEQESIHNC